MTTATAFKRQATQTDLAVVHSQGRSDLAMVYVARLADGSHIEFAESFDAGQAGADKWVLIVSTLKGCPVECPICDAGGSYRGKLTSDEILAQILHLVDRRFPGRGVPVSKLKVQFARMGDPGFNDAVLAVLERLPEVMDAPGLMPCISTVAPAGRESFFARLLEVKNRLYAGGRFQMQFSLHTTDEAARLRLVPVRTWSFAEMAGYGRGFFRPGERKVTLNFAAVEGAALDPAALLRAFSPEVFAVKLTPVNPTASAVRSGLKGLIDPDNRAGAERIADTFRDVGYETILSIGEVRENAIGSNCGMYVSKLRG